MKKTIFYKCKSCDNFFLTVNDGKVNPVCCGEKMEELIAGTIDASFEKHVPMVNIKDNLVTVDIGSVPHPMIEEHRIEWIYVETKKGGLLKRLDIGAEPKEIFSIIEDEVTAVYEYCNLHGLWEFVI
ncbi:MAG: desulfoferrodoxin family protein [Clostridia bacterium]|nr:desulfoferrodoxin family protein [Clostridia bacterium]MDD4375703.1 desulfoferrodoxin family protein [Clostridia bacterium]